MSSKWVAEGAGTSLLFLINKLRREGTGFPACVDALDLLTSLAGRFGWKATTNLKLDIGEPMDSYDVERMVALQGQPDPTPYQGQC